MITISHLLHNLIFTYFNLLFTYLLPDILLLSHCPGLQYDLPRSEVPRPDWLDVRTISLLLEFIAFSQDRSTCYVRPKRASSNQAVGRHKLGKVITHW